MKNVGSALGAFSWLSPLPMKGKAAIFGLLFVALTASAGGVDHGGNGVVIRSQASPHLVLWDLFVHDRKFADKQLGEPLPKRISVNPTPRSEVIDYRQFRAFGLLESRLRLWQSRAKNLVAAISEDHFALGEGPRKFMIPLLATPYSIAKIDELFVPQNLGTSVRQAFPAAFFDEAVGNVFLSKPVWDRMGLISQAALLLHERFRILQLYYQLPNEELQRLVAMIMTREPESVGDREYDDRRFSKSTTSLHGSGEISTLALINSMASLPLYQGYMDCRLHAMPSRCVKELLISMGHSAAEYSPEEFLESSIEVQEGFENGSLSKRPVRSLRLRTVGQRNRPLEKLPTAELFSKMYGSYSIESCEDKSPRPDRVYSYLKPCEVKSLLIRPFSANREVTLFDLRKASPGPAFQRELPAGTLAMAFKSPYSNYTETGANFSSLTHGTPSAGIPTFFIKIEMEQIAQDEYLLTLIERSILSSDSSVGRDAHLVLRLRKK